VFTSVAGTATTTTATLTVNAPPSVSVNPSNVTMLAGHVATFSASATGYPAPSVQWQSSTDGGLNFANMPGATGATLNVMTNKDMNGNRYRAVFTNAYGQATSTVATLTVQFAPTVTANPSAFSAVAGAAAKFYAAATGNPAPSVQWQVSTNAGASYTNLVGSTAVPLVITSQASQNGNLYRAVFANNVDSATTTAATLNVAALPTATLDIDHSVTATKYDALTDGLLVLRALFGLTGTGLTTNALGATATRTDPADVKAYIDSNLASFDIDGNGSVDALTDGLLILRYLLGLIDNALVTGAIGPGATRGGAAQVQAYLLLLTP